MRKTRLSSILALAACFGTGLPTAFGITGHSPGNGATDAQHIALAAQPQFQAGGWFSYTNSSTGDTDYESAVLVDQNWAVTSADNVLDFNGSSFTSRTLSGIKVGFGANALTDSTKYSVTQIIRPPGFNTTNFAGDLAFLRLATPVTGVTPVPIFTGTLSAGQELTSLGYGQPGNPSAGLLPYDGIERGMINMLASNAEKDAIFPGTTKMLMTDFWPDNLQGNYESLGGQLAEGDFGGAVMISDNGTWKLAGINSFTTGSPYYGTNSFYTDLTGYTDWIASQPALAFLVPEPAACSILMMVGAAGLLKRRVMRREDNMAGRRCRKTKRVR